ncbi:MAG: hypothetical protein ACXWE8_04740, partial [Solirubrobacterales bacterium]
MSASRTRAGPLAPGSSGGVGKPAPSRMPSSSSSSASPAVCSGSQPSSLRARALSMIGTARAMSSQPGGVGWRRSFQVASAPKRRAAA